MKFLFLFFTAISLPLFANYKNIDQFSNLSYNSFGQIGLIQTPSANIMDEGSVHLTTNVNDIWKFGTMTASPFNWFEASYFYYRPRDLIWEGTRARGDYLDKGFNLKVLYRPKNKYLPNFAIGLDDFAGTGFFTKEYLVATKNHQNIRYSLGIGWGKFASGNNFENPLKIFSEKLSYRPISSDNYQLGGAPSYDQWFRGNASIFGGLEWVIPKSKGVILKVEYDPFDYFDFSAGNRPDALFNLRKKDSSINLGLSYELNKYVTLQSSFIKGNTFNFSFTLGSTFNGKGVKKEKFNPKISNSSTNNSDRWENRSVASKRSFYIDLLDNLNTNKFWLQTANVEDSKIDTVIMAENHLNHIRSSSRAASIIKSVSDNHNLKTKMINISHMNEGVEINKISYLANKVNNDIEIFELIKEYSKFQAGDKIKSSNNEFKPSLPLPMIFSEITPVFLTHIGVPEKFLTSGLAIRHSSQTLFKRNLILTSELNLSIDNNFRNSISGNASLLPYVRTDIVQYLKGGKEYITRLQLDHMYSPAPEVYTHLMGGIFEAMYGGIGIEMLYKPFDKRYTVGFNIFEVKKRGFDQKFKFLDYQTSTGHINFTYELLNGIKADISYGRYLAKDDGFTFDFSRRSSSGFKAGVWVTQTNISAQVFGEGSFDKGFYWQIPFDTFTGKYSGRHLDYMLRPLTRDGGQKLMFGKSLNGSIFNSNQLELNRDWPGHIDY